VPASPMPMVAMSGLTSCQAFVLTAWVAQVAAKAPRLDFKVTARYPHQRECFTEGLFLNGSQNEVFESCGLYGRSYLRKYKLNTGETVKTAKVPSRVFSEGLAYLGDKLYMLTYHSGEVLEYDVRSFQQTPRTHPFPYGEGWGLTTDGCDLLATTGSSFIYRLRPGISGTLGLVSQVQVTHQGKPVTMLNELEYVTPKIWVNQWHTDNIWRVDPTTGICEAFISVRGLHRWRGEETPNGIAYSHALGPQTLLVTGKLWPHMFSLQMSQHDLCGGAALLVPSCPKAPSSACWSPAGLGAVPASNASPLRATPVPADASRVAPASAASGKASPKAATKEVGQAVALLPHTPVQPLPDIITVVSLLLAAAVAVAAVVVPLCIHSRRHRYKLAMQRAEPDGSA